jgi:hypothetical protein
MPKKKKLMKLSQGKIRQQISRRIKDALVSTLRHYDRAQSNNGSTISTVDDVGHPYIDKLVREMVNTLYKDGLDDLEGLGDTKLKVPTIEEVIELAKARSASTGSRRPTRPAKPTAAFRLRRYEYRFKLPARGKRA